MHLIPDGPTPHRRNNCRNGNNSSLRLAPAHSEPTSLKLPPLSDEETALLGELEDLLKNEGRASLGAAKALYSIQEKRLYRGHDNSMRKYGRRWNYSPAYTCRLIQSGAVYYRLEPLWRDNGLPEPTSEWQLRP